MFKKRKQCCVRNRSGGSGLFLISVGFGMFFAYAIPRYMLITLLGLALISVGICFLIKK